MTYKSEIRISKSVNRESGFVNRGSMHDSRSTIHALCGFVLRISIFVALVLIMSCTRAIVAEVDDFKITSSDLETSIKVEKEKYDPILLKTDENAKAFKRAVLENLIQEAALLSAARKADVTVDKEELKKFMETESIPAMLKKSNIPADFWKERQRRRMIISKFIDKNLGDKIRITDEEIQGYYKEHKSDFYQPTQFHARQIVVDNKETANKILERIKKGEDFARLAEEFSLSPDRKHGGDLGFFNVNSFPPIFAEICGKLKPGETSGVVASDYGFQIFELIEKRDARQRTIEESKGEIEMLLKEKDLGRSFDAWFKDIRNNAKVQIHEKILEGINV